MARKLLRKLRQKEPPDLDITAFMNLMVALVPFLLVTAVFSRVSILQLDLPAAVGESEAGDKKLTVEVIVRKDRIEIGDGVQIVTRIGNIDPAMTRAVPAAATGEQPAAAAQQEQSGMAQQKGYDLATLNKVLMEIKGNYPSKLDATVLMEPDLEYDILVQVMDAVSSAAVTDSAGKLQKYELFPQISVGDAPIIEG
ncbi:MAG TPA: biopolymer transporter ExbD [Gammaproteobacteria bacterium]|nr:biopolymer transporter ExbD [Gammaproteobacteria bacterium]